MTIGNGQHVPSLKIDRSGGGDRPEANRAGFIQGVAAVTVANASHFAEPVPLDTSTRSRAKV